MTGVLNLDKPIGISSARAVSRVKRLLPRGTKIGHAGTLDPFASGVLVLLIGKATRLSEQFMSEPKRYDATVKLGATTETLDPESEEVVDGNAGAADVELVGEVLTRFIGEIQQMPPVYSALKVNGRRAYAMARAGQEVVLRPRAVSVYSIELLDYAWPTLRVRVDCGRGTYIRSLARDIGLALGTTGYLTQLRRTRVGPCLIDAAVTLEHLNANGVEGSLLPGLQTTPQTASN